MKIFIILFLFVPFQLNAQQWQWVSQIVGDRAKITSVDAHGESIYCTGIFANTIEFLGNNTNSLGGEDAFVAKLNAEGEVQWVKFLAGTLNESLNCVRADANGDIWVTGGKSIDVSFAGQLTGDGYFIAVKLSADGEVLWLQESSQYGGPGVDIAFDSHNNGFICGWHAKFMSGGQFYGLNDIFVLKIGSEGNLEWTKRAGGSGNDQAYGIEVVRDTSVFVVGQVADPNVYFGNIYLINSQSHGNAFIAEYSSIGTFKRVTFSDFAAGFEIFTDVIHREEDDKLYVCGVTGGTFGYTGGETTTTTSNGDQDYLLLRMNTSCVADTIVSFGVAAIGCNDQFNEMALTEESIWLTGKSSCDGTMNGYPLNVQAGSVSTGTVFRLNYSLQINGLYSIPNGSRGYASSIASNSNSIFVGGMLGIGSQFAGLAYSNVIDSLGFVAKIGNGVVTETYNFPNQTNELKLGPNPVTDFLHFHGSDLLIREVNVIDFLGRCYTFPFEEISSGVLNLTNLPNGIYSIKVATENGLTTQSLILKQ